MQRASSRLPSRRNHEPELFWALRGGGGNLGLVTAMEIRPHRVPALVSGMIMYPWPQAASRRRCWYAPATPALDFDGTVEWLRDEGLACDQAGRADMVVMTGVTPSRKFEYRVIGDTVAQAHEIADQVNARFPAV